MKRRHGCEGTPGGDSSNSNALNLPMAGNVATKNHFSGCFVSRATELSLISHQYEDKSKKRIAWIFHIGQT